MERDDRAASTSASHFPSAPGDTDDDAPPMPFPSRGGYSHHHHHNFPLSRYDDDYQRRFGPTDNYPQTTTQRNDACSGLITFITFCCFVSMTLIFGVYGPEIYKLGPHASILIKPNPLFVENVKVERLDLVQNKLMLYGFDGTPPLSVVTSWSDSRKVLFSGVSHKEWMYFLNVGSKVDISYNVTSLLPSPVVLVIAEGIQGLTDWLEDPGSPKLTLLWKPIYGIGEVGHDIRKSASYYIAVGNLNPAVVEVELQIRIKALLYDTKNANYKCAVSLGTCVLKIPFTGGNTALLAFSDPQLGIGNGKSRVQLSYGPRWITYLGGVGGVIVLVSMAVHGVTKCRRFNQGESSSQENMEPQGAPLIPRKDDDVASLGSSYDSLSQDHEDPEDEPTTSSKGNAASDNEYDNNTRRLCAICFDAPRDCFFLPCGHCVSCYACGTKIAEVAGTCPICRRHMKKVKKIYTV